MMRAVHDKYAVALLMVLFWAGALWQADLPGLYMDGINPDYLAARFFNRALPNAVWILPAKGPILLGSLYHGVQNYYVDLPVFWLLGISLLSIRIAQSLFGAAIVLLLYFLAVRVTQNRLVALLAAALLATDIAFLASFRTQFYIVLGGEAWLFASLLALWSRHRAGPLLSGLFFGLALYGYFVLAFFLPAMIVLVLAQPRRPVRLWAGGVALGLLPYVLGYVFLFRAIGGVSSGMRDLTSRFSGAAPLSAPESLWERIEGAFALTRLAITNGGNEAMIFSEALGSPWGELKFALFAGILVLALLRLRWTPPHRLIVLLPVSYLICATLLGSRLWVHHYSVLVPLGYLLLAVTVGDLARDRRFLAVSAMAALALLAVNVGQSVGFHRELAETGGVRKQSDALTRLAQNARERPPTLYVFPEWGFFMSFALLTENRVRYVLDPAEITREACACDQVALAYWNDADTAGYRSLLEAKNLRNIETTAYAQRDGRPAFHLMTGTF
ncbi:hypothetical protein FHS55_002666 [Angulomicrobium tetraedrale]|uniref:Glycosyltransferase RgtA/B/C/D-like domain-containing protein n=1 Tax=Ancylobacter tetraedralis TaxID=217068 RepID=A0A839ZBF9_9HYPH|nr:glycosyltransferase family 39 protein [Ancylobacter tetraedralis]MBB3772057.1 hypothetical protein [Ancylobacter tetraedralis]